MVHLRTGLPHAALAELYGTARSTVSRAIGEIRPLPAARGFAVPDRPGVRLHTLTDEFAYAEAAGIRLRSRGRRGLPGPGQRVPRPGQRPAQEAEGRCTARQAVRTAGDTPPTVLGPDLRRAHQCRTEAVAPAPAPHPPTRGLRRDLPGHRFIGFGPFGSPTHPPQAEHRARARPAGRLLINHQPTRQAGTPKPQSRTKS
ncbi:transposase family protein [Streptomyces sp. NPDC096057]|uniref:transposase family protein n=1 Tax=Streptomyces sp. NPDC096057 TaxID=3155543 RepID=UPI00332214D2